MSSRFQQKRKYLVGILVLVLLLSIGLNLYDHLITFPPIQATTNNMRVEALKGWLVEMRVVKNFLEIAETNVDVRDTSVHTSWAKRFVKIFQSGINVFEPQKELYYWVGKTTFFLDEALLAIYFGNQTGYVTERNLDQNILTMIKNVTTNIGNLESKITPKLSSSGVEPTQQLRDADVLSDVLDYLEQIYQVSVDILDYYQYYH